jgi:tRNA-splicing ligase RtcB
MFREAGEHLWELPKRGAMRVPGRLYASRALVESLDSKVAEQLANVASLPGIVGAAWAMPDAHWGYGFPIGGVAAFDPDAGGVVSAGGVGFDISCGVRTYRTGVSGGSLGDRLAPLAEELFRSIPAGVGSEGALRLSKRELDELLVDGARWAVRNGYGVEGELAFVEERGRMAGADPTAVSDRAKERQAGEVGTLGSGNHYLELQVVDRLFDRAAADAFGLSEGDLLVSIHCGSRGLGHQIGTDYLKILGAAASRLGVRLPDRELASAPIRSAEGRAYLGAMRAAINCALANRQVVGHLVREAFARRVPEARLSLLYDVSHNTCKEETHAVDGNPRRLFVHRKGATRAFGPGHPELPGVYRGTGQPVLVGGTMGTFSFVLAGNREAGERSFFSSCHGAGRAMSRTQAKRTWRGGALIEELAGRGILIRAHSASGAAEEAPGAYKDVEEVARVAEAAGLSRRVARLRPVACIKG